MRLALIITLFAIGVSAPFSSAFAGCDPNEKRLVFPHDSPARNNPKGEAASFLAEMINAEFEGRLCLDVLSDQPGFTAMDAIAGLKSGEFDIIAPSMGGLGDVSDRFLIFEMPFLFKNLDSVVTYQESDIGRRLLEEANAEGLIGLAYWNDGLTAFTSSMPLARPEDLANAAIAVQSSEIARHFLNALQAEPVIVANDEFQPALQSLQAIGQSNSLAGITSRNAIANQTNVLVTSHGFNQFMLMTSENVWAEFSPEDRQLLELLIAVATLERNKYAFDFAEQSLANLSSSGLAINHLSEEDRYEWVLAMQPTWFEYGGQVGFDQIAAALHVEREMARGNLIGIR